MYLKQTIDVFMLQYLLTNVSCKFYLTLNYRNSINLSILRNQLMYNSIEQAYNAGILLEKVVSYVVV